LRDCRAFHRYRRLPRTPLAGLNTCRAHRNTIPAVPCLRERAALGSPLLRPPTAFVLTTCRGYRTGQTRRVRLLPGWFCTRILYTHLSSGFNSTLLTHLYLPLVPPRARLPYLLYAGSTRLTQHTRHTLLGSSVCSSWTTHIAAAFNARTCSTRTLRHIRAMLYITVAVCCDAQPPRGCARGMPARLRFRCARAATLRPFYRAGFWFDLILRTARTRLRLPHANSARTPHTRHLSPSGAAYTISCGTTVPFYHTRGYSCTSRRLVFTCRTRLCRTCVAPACGRPLPSRSNACVLHAHAAYLTDLLPHTIPPDCSLHIAGGRLCTAAPLPHYLHPHLATAARLYRVCLRSTVLLRITA